MKFNVLNRKVHYWASFIIAIPVGIIICTGVLLQMKKQFVWVQPPEQRGTGSQPQLSLDDILNRVKTVPDMNVQSWDDVNRLDVRPGRGMVKVWLMNGWEVQVDLGTGAILQTAYRRSDFIESIHDGSVFAGDWTKLGIFLPTGLTLLLLWATGMWMWWIPWWRKRSVRHRKEAAALAGYPLPTTSASGRTPLDLTKTSERAAASEPRERSGAKGAPRANV